jgi:hypothetical protein
MAFIKPFERCHPEKLISEAKAEERNGRIEERVHVKSMDVLRWAVRVGEREMALEQGADAGGSRVVNRDPALCFPSHCRGHQSGGSSSLLRRWKNAPKAPASTATADIA